MRELVASLFLLLDDAAAQPDQFVTDVNHAMEENLRSAPR